MARENLNARDTGYANEDVKQLMAAICLRACVDYKKATMPLVRDTYLGKRTLKDCRKFFGSDIFQYFVNDMPVREVEKVLRKTPLNRMNQTFAGFMKDDDSQKIQGLL